MKTLTFPYKQIMNYVFTGKFKAPSGSWQHGQFDLNEYELFVMTEGTLYITYNHENFTVSSGEYLILPPSSSLREGFRPAYCSFYWLHFSTNDQNQPIESTPPSLKISSDGSPEYFTIPQMGQIPKLEKVVVLMKQLQDAVKSHYPSMVLDVMTTTILAELYGQLSLLAPKDTTTALQKQVYLDILDYVKLHISENIRVSDIAAHFGYNSKYLSHLFAEITGIPLKQFIMTQKMDTANFMLSDTNKSISEIAKELGFSDAHNFARAYKKVTGLTPSDYRNAFAKRLLYHV